MYSVKRVWVRAGIAAVIVGTFAATGAGQGLQVSQVGQMGQQRGTYLAIPGLTQLGQEHVQHKLELLDGQKEKLLEISNRYREQQREAWGDYRNIPAEERQARMAEIREATNKLSEKARIEAEKVLLPHQVKELKDIVFRSRAQYSLRNPRILDELEVDEDQREELVELRQELMERMRALNEEMLDKSLKVLTSKQLKELREMDWQSGGRGYGYGGVTTPAVKKPK